MRPRRVEHVLDSFSTGEKLFALIVVLVDAFAWWGYVNSGFSQGYLVLPVVLAAVLAFWLFAWRNNGRKRER